MNAKIRYFYFFKTVQYVTLKEKLNYIFNHKTHGGIPMKKVLSALLLISMAGASTIYGACARCEWKNCNNNSTWVVKKGRAVRCAVNQTINRWTRSNGNEAVYRNRTNDTVTKTCTSKNCPIHNEGKACKNFCTQCGKHHSR